MAPPSPSNSVATAVSYCGKDYHVVREGLAEILTLAAPAAKNGESKVQTVFYNPIQQYNRDLSVLAIRAFADDYTYLQDAKPRTRRAKLPAPKGKKRKRGQDEESDEKSGASLVGRERKEEDIAQNGSTGERKLSKTAIEEGDTVTEADKICCGRPIESRSIDTDLPNEHKPGKRPFRILDALSATGLRALRYGKEVPLVTSITANDLSISATNAIRLNVEHNGLSHKIQPATSDAIDHMLHSTGPTKPGAGQYHVIDLDPYGTAAPFFDAAVRALVDGGLLCVTCTDAGVFASLGYLEKTYSQYGGLPLKGPHAHEGGLRLILHAIATAGARYGIAIEPLLSLSIDFYARIFVRIHRSPAEVKFLASKTMMVYNCDAGCGAWSIQHLAHARATENKHGGTIYKFTAALGPSTAPQCEHCGFRTHVAGPMWGGPIHNPHFVEQILSTLPSLDKEVYATKTRIEGMLTIALNESLDDGVPCFLKHCKAPATRSAEPPVGGPASDPSSNPPTASNLSKPEHAPAENPRPVPSTNPALRAHHPFFFVPSHLSGTLHCINPPDSALRGALAHLGYRTSRSHTKPGSIATDAPWSVIWEMMREWIHQDHPLKEDALRKGTAGYGIMSKDRRAMRMRDVRETLAEAQKSQDVDDVEQKLQALLYRLSSRSSSGGTKKNDDDDDDNKEEKKGRPAAIRVPGGGQDSDVERSTTPQQEQEGKTKKKREEKEKNVTGPLRPHEMSMVFDEELGKRAEGGRGKGMVRYQQNPPDWGPMHKAKGGVSS